jgi:hypothetical protein
MQMHISKALQTRSLAIRNALDRYNAAAAKLNPPRELLTYSTIVEYSFVGDFSLLKTSREDIRLQDWARPAVREAMVKQFQLERAHEEIIRLNVEMRRLHTAIRDESENIAACIEELVCSGDTVDALLAEEVRFRWELKSRVNALHVDRLHTIEETFGYSGIPGCGVRQGHLGDCRMVNMGVAQDSVVEELSEEPGGQYADDELLHDFERLSIGLAELN